MERGCLPTCIPGLEGTPTDSFVSIISHPSVHKTNHTHTPIHIMLINICRPSPTGLYPMRGGRLADWLQCFSQISASELLLQFPHFLKTVKIWADRIVSLLPSSSACTSLLNIPWYVSLRSLLLHPYHLPYTRCPVMISYFHAKTDPMRGWSYIIFL